MCQERMREMKHHTVRTKLLRYRDGDLPEHERRDVQRHLSVCQSCRDDLRVLAAAWDADRRAARIRPPERLWAGVSAALARRDRERKLDAAVRGFGSRAWRPAAAVAATLGLVLGGVGLGVALTTSPAGFQETRVAGTRDDLGLSYFEVLPPGSIGARLLMPAPREAGR